MISPAATPLVTEAVFTIAKSGDGAATVTLSSASIVGNTPLSGVDVRVAIFVIGMAASMSSCVIS